MRGLLLGGFGGGAHATGRSESARACSMGMLAGINRRYPRAKRLGAAPSSNAIWHTPESRFLADCGRRRAGICQDSNLWSNAKRVHLLSNLLSKLRICPGTLSRRRRTYVQVAPKKMCVGGTVCVGCSWADSEVGHTPQGAQNRHARGPWVCWRESTVATRVPSDWGPRRAPTRSDTHPNLDSWPTADDPELGFVSNSNLWSNAKRVHLLSNLLSKLRICPGTLSR